MNKRQMKAYILGHGGDGVYTLVLENGYLYANHWCSHFGYAAGDLYTQRPERQAHFERMGIELDVDNKLYKSETDLPEPTSELFKAYYVKNPAPKTPEQIEFEKLSSETKDK
jgi:hypothetical protein